MTDIERKQIVDLTNSHRIPTIFFERDSVVEGGLITYSANFADSFRQVGLYVGRILKGDKPADLPVLQAAKFDLIINLKTAKTIDLKIPPACLRPPTRSSSKPINVRYWPLADICL